MGTEDELVEQPIINHLKSMGYKYLPPSENEDARDDLNNVILRDTLINSLIRINDIPDESARIIYQELLTITDNEEWLKVQRGDYSKIVPGQKTKKTIHLIDFKNPDNNTFTVSNQFKVEAEHNRIPDVVVFINGIPVVVIEAKSPASFKDKTGEAFDQIKQYEQQIPRLFYSNAFNIITNGKSFLYGATGSPSQFWGYWRDPWPKTNQDFESELEKGLYSLLNPERFLDLVAHFIVFEKRDNKVIKKICRYQQYRCANKLVNRILEDRKPEERRALTWASTGSGKSLSMVFTVLKLKQHLNIDRYNPHGSKYSCSYRPHRSGYTDHRNIPSLRSTQSNTHEVGE